jgi:hypothetical protein
MVFDERPKADKLLRGDVALWPMFADLPERRSLVYVSAPWVIKDY